MISSTSISSKSSDCKTTDKSHTTNDHDKSENAVPGPSKPAVVNEAVVKNESSTKSWSRLTEQELLDKLSDYRFIAVTHLMMDIIPYCTELNMIFQKQLVDIAAIKPAVKAVIDSITKGETGCGYYMKELRNHISKEDSKVLYKGMEVKFDENAKDDVKDIRITFCSLLKSKIQSRFPTDSCDVVGAFDVLGMRPLSFLSADDLAQYGNSEIDILIEHFGTDKTTKSGAIVKAIIDSSKIKPEWSLLKKVVLEQKYPRANTMELWQIISSFYSDTFPNLLKLAQIAILLPLQTADVERGFSCQNLVHNSQRNRLDADTLNKLMTVDLVGPPIDQFQFENAVAHWKSVKRRNIFK